MARITEIRWHGRGGQGAKTAALLLAEAAAIAGKYVQGFPEYGPERMGAPVTSFNRISDQPISVHSSVSKPNIVVVLDPTLLSRPDVVDGLEAGAAIIVNSEQSVEEIRVKLNLENEDIRLYTVDASKIAKETIGRNIPNTPLMGALIRVTEILPYEEFMTQMKEQLESKFRHKPEVIEGNLAAIERAYREVLD